MANKFMVDKMLATHLRDDGQMTIHQRQVWIVGILDHATCETKVFTVGNDRSSETL